MVMLSGNITVQASSGPTRELAAGDLLLLEDTVGKGHQTTNTGNGDAFVLTVHLA
jgi:quercetin dioxygenase-like cupin family protein